VQLTKEAGVTVVPTEFSMETYVNTDSAAALARRPELRYVPPALRDQWLRQKENFARNAGVTAERAAAYRDLRRGIIRELHDAGVPIALGSDAFTLYGVPGEATFQELAIYVALGMTPYEALRTSTTAVARLLRMSDVTGTIRVGGAADLVLLDANPLADVSNVRRQAGVMLRGRWLSPESIRQMLDRLAQ
jgi:imidazolonepropionase-like amidohydrolase